MAINLRFRKNSKINNNNNSNSNNNNYKKIISSPIFPMNNLPSIKKTQYKKIIITVSKITTA